MNEKNIFDSPKELLLEKRYLTARSVAESLKKAGLITEQELSEIDTKLLEKYKPSLSTLLSGKPLIYRG